MKNTTNRNATPTRNRTPKQTQKQKPQRKQTTHAKMPARAVSATRTRTSVVTSNMTPEQHVSQFRKMSRQDRNLSVSDYRKAYGIPNATFYDWRRKYAPTMIRK